MGEEEQRRENGHVPMEAEQHVQPERPLDPVEPRAHEELCRDDGEAEERQGPAQLSKETMVARRIRDGRQELGRRDEQDVDRDQT